MRDALKVGAVMFCETVVVMYVLLSAFGPMIGYTERDTLSAALLLGVLGGFVAFMFRCYDNERNRDRMR